MRALPPQVLGAMADIFMLGEFVNGGCVGRGGDSGFYRRELKPMV